MSLSPKLLKELRDWTGMKDDPRELTDIDPDVIIEQMSEHATSFLSVGILYSSLKANVRSLRLDLKVACSEADAKIRHRHEGSRKPTEAQIKAEIEKDRKVLRIENEVTEAESDLLVLEFLLDALRQRRYLLTEIASVRRSSEGGGYITPRREDPTRTRSGAEGRQAPPRRRQLKS